jgi:hypothetical protein
VVLVCTCENTCTCNSDCVEYNQCRHKRHWVVVSDSRGLAVSPRSNLADDCVSNSLQLTRQLLDVTSKDTTELVSLGSVGELPPKSPAEIGGR